MTSAGGRRRGGWRRCHGNDARTRTGSLLRSTSVACRVVRFRPGAVGRARPGPARAAGAAGGPAARRRSAPGGSPPASGCRPRATLARDLGLSRGLVQECYEQLHAEGYLTSRGRLGHAGRRAVAAGAPRPRPRRHRAPTRRRRVADFASGVPDLRLAPARGLGVGGARGLPRRARTRPSTTATRAATPRLREVLAAYLRPGPGGRRRRRPGRSSARASAQGLALAAARARRARRDPVACEDPGVDRHGHRRGRGRRVARPCRCRSTSTASTSTRWPRAAPARCVVTPAHQWPTGVVLAPSAGTQLIAWAREHDARDRRGRLRRRVPLRPRPGRLAAGSRPGPRRRARHGQQVAGARRCGSAGLSCPAGAGRRRSPRRSTSPTAGRRRSTSSRSPR